MSLCGLLCRVSSREVHWWPNASPLTRLVPRQSLVLRPSLVPQEGRWFSSCARTCQGGQQQKQEVQQDKPTLWQPREAEYGVHGGTDLRGLSEMVQSAPRSGIRDMMQRSAIQQQRTGKPVIHLEAGQPNFCSPPLAIETAQRDMLAHKNQAYIPNGKLLCVAWG